MKPGDVLKIRYSDDNKFSTVELVRLERGFIVVKDLITGDEYPCRPQVLEILPAEGNKNTK